MSTESPDRFLRLADVLVRTGLKRSTLYRKMREGSFPRQHRIAERCVAWRDSDVRKWMDEQKRL
ncbi:helix-turn-helix transcriptional regulator [Sphingopyxis panaciterrulae]|uniref:helix-turn-helix transcriptional regulator n=1 Tax=Sphingopyxis panaciterrulae TaxID=462372 RepID=UPI0016141956|nr:AlpA family phage regulatory protein [Sphingopyxis panaciterrulae]